MNITTQEVLIVDNKHPIFLTEDDIRHFNWSASCVNKELDRDGIIKFMTNHIYTYYRGKSYGFNDTEIREEICKKLESFSANQKRRIPSASLCNQGVVLK